MMYVLKFIGLLPTLISESDSECILKIIDIYDDVLIVLILSLLSYFLLTKF